MTSATRILTVKESASEVAGDSGISRKKKYSPELFIMSTAAIKRPQTASHVNTRPMMQSISVVLETSNFGRYAAVAVVTTIFPFLEPSGLDTDWSRLWLRDKLAMANEVLELDFNRIVDLQ